MTKRSSSEASLPPVSKQLTGGFRIFNRRYLRKHFHAIAFSAEQEETRHISESDSVVVYANHASWWDPLLAIFLAESLLPKHGMYAPIDAEAFEKYKIFGKMGFYPIAQNSLQGAKDFLRVSRSILSQPATSVWVTPEGRFADARDHDAELMPGLAHLGYAIQNARKDEMEENEPSVNAPVVWFVPTAIEYVFWEEKKPEILVRFGQAIRSDTIQLENKAAWAKALTENLRQAQRDLAQLSIARDTESFELLLRSKSGTFFLYDWWRTSMSRFTGSGSMRTEHSDKF
ncbi:MAG: lysophospholipid acyltransferase family protein [Planctomycetota bacterium]